MAKITSVILKPVVVDGKMVFIPEEQPMVNIEDVLTKESLLSLAIQRFVIRHSSRFTNSEEDYIKANNTKFKTS